MPLLIYTSSDSPWSASTIPPPANAWPSPTSPMPTPTSPEQLLTTALALCHEAELVTFDATYLNLAGLSTLRVKHLQGSTTPAADKALA